VTEAQWLELEMPRLLRQARERAAPVTHAEWLVSPDALKMLRSICDSVSHRKLHLFQCACCFRQWHLLSEEIRTEIKLVELHAEDLRLPDQSIAAEWFEWHFDQCVLRADGHRGTLCAVGQAVFGMWSTDPVPEAEVEKQNDAARLTELRAQSEIVRDMYGTLPFHAVPIDPQWLGWRDRTVEKIAQSIYADRSFESMPILADALEEAGCADPLILAHCREKRGHVRGCWVLDLLLGKS
jgi:hypothetical protein